jgi:hypothetical protein
MKKSLYGVDKLNSGPATISLAGDDSKGSGGGGAENRYFVALK